MHKVNNAFIMAAGTSSRFAPLSYEKPKGLISVKGEVLIERQIKQLKEAGIDQIYIVVGYKKDFFNYLEDKYQVKLIENNDFLTRNNNGSIYAIRNCLKNSYICSSDNYFAINPFKKFEKYSFYSSVFAHGKTNEWCISANKKGIIEKVTIGGNDSWVMLGHCFWSKKFSKKFVNILENEYSLEKTSNKLWEQIYIEHINDLKMHIKKYDENVIFEFDTLDELRIFDQSYLTNSNSKIISKICAELKCNENQLNNFATIKAQNESSEGFTFNFERKTYKFTYKNMILEEIL